MLFLKKRAVFYGQYWIIVQYRIILFHSWDWKYEFLSSRTNDWHKLADAREQDLQKHAGE